MFKKWELVEENVPAERVISNGLGMVVSRDTVYIDVYRKKKWDGTWKYKKVVR